MSQRLAAARNAQKLRGIPIALAGLQKVFTIHSDHAIAAIRPGHDALWQSTATVYSDAIYGLAVKGHPAGNSGGGVHRKRPDHFPLTDPFRIQGQLQLEGGGSGAVRRDGDKQGGFSASLASGWNGSECHRILKQGRLARSTKDLCMGSDGTGPRARGVIAFQRNRHPFTRIDDRIAITGAGRTDAIIIWQA